jgi:ABC-type Fe3+-siderophore transport system permease subunit
MNKLININIMFFNRLHIFTMRYWLWGNVKNNDIKEDQEMYVFFVALGYVAISLWRH